MYGKIVTNTKLAWPWPNENDLFKILQFALAKEARPFFVVVYSSSQQRDKSKVKLKSWYFEESRNRNA